MWEARKGSSSYTELHDGGESQMCLGLAGEGDVRRMMVREGNLPRA